MTKAPLRIAINGYGRIGRLIVRALFESNKQQQMKIVAINDVADLKTNAHLTQYDSTHGRFPAEVLLEEKGLSILGESITFFSERDPEKLPWKALNIDVVFECTGRFTSKELASAHLKAGARKVIISAPSANPVDATVVFGVNHHLLNEDQQIISNASCTTNCLAPIAKPLHEKFRIINGLMNTIHAYTNDQNLLDATHSDLHRARAAAHSLIPSKTGAAAAVGLVIPELLGKLDGYAIRVPTMNVSVVDFTFTCEEKPSVEAINQTIEAAAKTHLAGIVAINKLPLVSCDFNHHPASAIFDCAQTKVSGHLVKVLAWYDNEWGFSNRMLDVAQSWLLK